MRLDYKLDERPPLLRSIVLGLQWAVIVTALVIILGKVAAGLAPARPEEQIAYLQKLFFVTGAAVLIQVLWGHRLPVVTGPSTIVLLGVIANQGASPQAVYTAVMAGGLMLAVLAVGGLFGLLRRLFTRRVVAVVLMLIALTLCPTILKLITVGEGDATPLGSITFALGLMAAMFLLHRALSGFWKSTLMIWAMVLGSLAYLLLFGPTPSDSAAGDVGWARGFFTGLTSRPALAPGVLISLLISFLAVSINDIGAIQSMGPLLQPAQMERRITRGMALTGLANVVAGFFGVIGVVNFSLSPGVVASTACASQYALVPAAASILLLSFSPRAIEVMAGVPSVVIGCVLLYIMTSQFASGLLLAFQGTKEGHFELDDGLMVGLPVLLGTLIAFLPAETVSALPPLLRPIVGSGFVVGTVSALVLEHLVFRR